MSIRKLLEQGPPPERVETVTHKGQNYILKGRPDASLAMPAMLLSDAGGDLKSRHWERVNGAKVAPEVVKHVLIVHKALQPDEGEDPYDETEIALLSATDSALFMKLLAASYTVLGLAEAEEIFNQVAAGNLPEHQDSNSNSTSGASSAEGNPPAGSEPNSGPKKRSGEPPA